MVQVSIDVDACTGLVAQLRAFHGTATTQRARVQKVARDAHCSSAGVDALKPDLEVVSRVASDLDARVTLAVLVNSGDTHTAPGSVVTFSVDGEDTPDAVKLALGKQLGARLAQNRTELQRYVDGVDADGDGKDDPMPPELMNRLAGYVTLLEKYQGDGPAATGLLMSLGPDGFLALPATVNRALADYRGKVTLPNGSTVEDDVLAQRFLRASGQLLATGVTWDKKHGVDLPYGAVAGRTTQYLPDDFGTQLAQSAYDHVGDGHGVGLSQVLRYGTYPKEFLLDVGDRLDALEQQWTKEHGDRALWGRDVRNLDLAAFGMGTEDKGGHYDPFVGLFEAMGRTPPAAADFFNPDAGGKEAQRRAHYFFQERTWDHDGFNAVAMALDAGGSVYHVPYPGDPQDAEALARWRRQAEQSAWLTSAGVHHLALRDPGEEKRRIGDQGKDSLAHLLALYMADVDRVAAGVNTPTDPKGARGIGVVDPQATWLKGYPPGAAFDVDDLNAVLGETLTNKDAATYFGRRTAEFNAARLQVAAQHYQDGTSTFRDAVTGAAGLRAYTLATMGAHLETRAEHADDHAKAYMTGAANAVGIVPVYGGALTFLVEGVLTAGGSNSLEKGWSDGQDNQVRDDEDLQWNAREDVRVEVALALQRAGIIRTGFSESAVQSDPAARASMQAWLDGGNLPDDVKAVLNDLDGSFAEGAANGGKK
ncbi:DUF6571 family protein [Cellulomonas fengjieae]|uniref:DUF6571 family protein n=1 Tax=Cellulomonas fengjieae TaxID=2819978 RepID=UPI001AAFC54D|nr:DUF6571 family protein [Cellulomonas fengjieae]MBO3103173.1 hypothetical protein [Cellulomonas fengjieae]